jgi:hypothetical protein
LGKNRPTAHALTRTYSQNRIEIDTYTESFNTKTEWPALLDDFGGFAAPISFLEAAMADAVARQPVRRPLRVVRIKNENESVANVQRIMQGSAYQEKKERRAATWNAAGCGSGLSESDMELVRDRSRPKDRCVAEINVCVLTGDAHGTSKAAALGQKI